MPELTIETVLFLLGVGAFTVTAAVMDTRTRRIPNKLTVPVFLIGWAYQAVFHGWSGLADAGLAFAAGFGILFILWMIGGGGGGDVKLMGALSVWLGFENTLLVLVASTACVFVASLGVLLWSFIARGPYKTKRKFVATGRASGHGQEPPKETLADRQRRRIMGYAVPVAIATWVIVLWKLPEL